MAHNRYILNIVLCEFVIGNTRILLEQYMVHMCSAFYNLDLLNQVLVGIDRKREHAI
jgi:hypothetical protein